MRMTEHAACTYSNMLAVNYAHLAVDQGCFVPRGTLNEAWCAAGKIVHQFGLQVGDAVRVEHIHVRFETRGKQTSVLEAHDSCRCRGDAPNAFSHGIKASVAYPVRKHEGHPACIHDLRYVRARITERGKGLIASEQFFQRLDAPVEDAQSKETPALSFSRQSKEGLAPVFSRGVRHGTQMLIIVCRVLWNRTRSHPKHLFDWKANR